MCKAKLADYNGMSGCYTGEKIAASANIFTLQVTPPNAHGFVNLGLCNFYSLDAIAMGRAAGTMRLVIAEVNDQMPKVFGNNWLHVSEVNFFVEHSSPLIEFGRGVPGELENRIGEYVAEQIRDGDTFQMGLGSIPEAVLARLEEERNLGVLSEMFPMGLPEMVDKGIVTNERKPFHKGVTVATFCLGNRAMYDYVNENPKCEFYPSTYTNNHAFSPSTPT